MSSWNQQGQNNMVMGQAQFTPYNNQNMWGGYNSQRLPVYKADPIHGENAAWAFPIGGGDIWLPDADRDLIWWIRIDQNGNKQVKSFDIKPHEEPQPVDVNYIMERLNSLEEKVNAKYNKPNAKRPNTPVAGADAPVE